MSVKTAARTVQVGMSDRLSVRDENSDLDVYRLDPLSHLDMGHVQIIDLETKRPVVFKPYDHEVELIDAWIDVEHLQATGELRWRNTVVEKSRQMGFSWTVCWVFLWAVMYHPVALLMRSQDLGDIDDGGNSSTPKSLFGRIREMASSQTWPEWQRPVNYLHFRQHPEHVITNEITGAYIVGAGKEDDPSRGGTYDAILLDEHAFIEHAESVERAVVMACPTGRLYGSTPNGDDNLFAQMVDQPRAGFEQVRLHWSQHPVYSAGMHVAGQDADCERCEGNRRGVRWDPLEQNAHRYPGKLTSPWYDAMVAQILDDESIAQELDISYERSLVARVYPDFSEELHVRPTVEYDSNVPVELSFDYGYAPSWTSVGIWQDTIGELRKIGELEVTEMTPDQVAEALRITLVDLGIPPMEVEPRFSRNWFAIGDPSGEAREQGTGESIVEQYRKQGFEIGSDRQPVRQTILAMKRLLYGVPKSVVYSAATCPKTIRHMKNNRYETDRFGKPKPTFRLLNDEHNHMTSADRYYVSAKFPAPDVWDGAVGESGFVKDELLPYWRLTRQEAEDLASANMVGDPSIKPDMRL